jgi:hypothetical protein
MLDELRAIFTREGITTAAIIDDVFDEIPTSTDLDQASWNLFLDDQSDQEISIIRDQYGVSDPDSRWDELRRDDNFVRFAWEHRANSQVFEALFRSYVDRQTGGKNLLEPLRVLLFDQLKLEGGTFGSTEDQAGAAAQILFVDLFLGSNQDDEAKDKALSRVERIVAPRREAPPMIVLMSSSPRLQTMRDDFRDKAGLFGCQFRTVKKSELSEPAEIQELLYRLSSSYRDSLHLSGFVELWRQALQEATSRFLKAARRLDLRDYADLQNLILNAEGQLIGAYLLEVFGQYFQFELEEDARLSAAALKLNEMKWENYPAPHFLPTSVSADIADGMLFRSQKILSKSEGIQFGDVLFSRRVDALGEGAEPIADFGKGERLALVAASPACDLQHRNATRVLFIAGVAKPSELILHTKPTALWTPVLLHNDIRYTIHWDLGAPVAWTLVELSNQLEAGSFERVRRFRSLFSLQLQQLFTSSLSRVGTPVMPPIQFMTGVTISYVDKDGIAQTLVSAQAAEGKAVLLVGRTERDYVDRLTLAQELTSEVRVKMQKLDGSLLRERDRERWKNAIQTRELFSKMEEGMVYDRGAFKRPFSKSAYDVVTVIGSESEKEKVITPDRRCKDDLGPVLIEIDQST